MIEALTAAIRANPAFGADLAGLLGDRMRQSLESSDGLPEPDGLGLERLVQSAGIFSLSVDPEARRIAFRIVTAAFELYGGALDGLADAVRLVMSRLGNFAALDFRKAIAERPSGLPFAALIEATRRRGANTVSAAGRDVALTDHQLLVWTDLAEGRSVVSTAPTSAGKSFVSELHVVQRLATGGCSTAVFLVPTRALISQVAGSLALIAERAPPPPFRVRTVPASDPDADGVPVVHVVTQERLQALLLDPDFLPELVVVDEAHLVGESGRGVILQEVLEEIVRRAPTAQFVFTMPPVRNPELFGDMFARGATIRRTADSPVGQNVILLSVDEARPDLVHARMWGEGDVSARLRTDRPLVAPDQKFAHLAWWFGRGAQNIVYAGTQSRCERLSVILRDLVTDEEAGRFAEERGELAQFVRDHVHPAFPLADAVLRGVAFHYGYIPGLVRRAVETAFERRQLDFVVCTSTLLQGVNLPARNLFMYRPEKGDEQPIGAVDFWNLAGRAGRLGREFEGNVFLVEYDEWDSRPLAAEREALVDPATRRDVLLRAEELLAYMATAVPERRDDAMENVFARLFRDHRSGRLDATLDAMDLPSVLSTRMRTRIEEVSRTIEVPDDVLAQNAQLSPHRQQRLYSKLMRDVPKKGVAYYMPPHPSGEWRRTCQRLINVYRRLQYELEGTKGDAYKRWAVLSLQWMRGQGLPDLIEYALSRDAERAEAGRSEGRRTRPAAPATVIRQMLEDVERHLRFRFVRLMTCYNSVLRSVLRTTGNDEYVAGIPSIPLFLEVGASSETMLSFVDLGLSRISSRLLQLRASDYGMDRRTAADWLRRQDLAALDLPRICLVEIEGLSRLAAL